MRRKFTVPAFVALTTTAALGSEKVIPFTSLPAPAQSAIKSRYPGAQVKKTEQEDEDGKTSYEIKLADKGAQLEVVLDPAGTVLAVEKVIPKASIPKAVKDGLEAKYPKATISRAEEVTKSGKVTYELKITTAEKKKTEVTFDDAGKFVEEEK
jgi:uncharacterized membrane protein YkoI